MTSLDPPCESPRAAFSPGLPASPLTLPVEVQRALDQATIQTVGLPGRLLMEVAGFGAFSELLACRQLLPIPAPGVLILAGKGNNAGDGFVLARFLASAGVPVRVICSENPLEQPHGSGDSLENARLLPAYGVPLETWTRETLAAALLDKPLVVDALLGTGLKGPVRSPFMEIIHQLSRPELPILALDLPSGLCGDTGAVLGAAPRCRWTVTFGALKPGFFRGEGPRLCGKIRLVPLPFPPETLKAALQAEHGSG